MSALLKYQQCSKYIQFSENDTSNHWPEVKKTQVQLQKQLFYALNKQVIYILQFMLVRFL